MSNKLLISVAATAAITVAGVPFAQAGEDYSEKDHQNQTSNTMDQNQQSGTMGQDQQSGTMGQEQTAGTLNQDQQVTAQTQEADRQRFDKLDRNKDGQLSEEELNIYGSTAAGESDQTGEADRGQRMMNVYDENDDGKVSREEFGNAPDTGRQYKEKQGESEDKEW